MISFPNGGHCIEHVSELPRPHCLNTLFLDCETTSRDDEKDSLNPWHSCWLLGIAVTFDDEHGAWYVPLRHREGNNLPIEPVREWVKYLLESCQRWVGHNVKYDAQVIANDLGLTCDGELYDTVTHAKIIDSDRQYKGGYGLDALSLAWLHDDISKYEVELKRWLNKRQDYGCVPIKPMAEYACQDVITNRRLYKYIEANLPTECDQVATMETELTKVLFEMERVGLCVDPMELALKECDAIARMLEIDGELLELLGRRINPSSSDDVYDVLVNQYGLPILAWTDEDDNGQPAGNASFDKHAMKLYVAHPYAPTKVVELIDEYRRLSTHRSLFLEKYQQLNVNGRLHASYNQQVRTGRMSCREPNAQQLDKQTKELIHPPDGCAFLSVDFSQIEFRVIVHFINDLDCIRAYNENPDTDFHDWVADMIGMGRDPAKTMNFMMGYGGGKKKTVKTLQNDKQVVGGIVSQVDKMIASGQISESQRQIVFDQLCKQKAESVYDEYHRTLPTLKPTSRRAAAVCYERGYVFNLHGRRRHLPKDFAHRAFNSLCQGEAADIQKERTVHLARALRGTPIKMVANVHDETLCIGPIDVIEDRRTQIAVAWILEHPARPLRVPLRVSMGTSRVHWREAGTSAAKGGPSKSVQYTDDEIEWLNETREMELFDWCKMKYVDDSNVICRVMI